MTTHAYEINFDGLVGMTHSFGGLALGNEPSLYNEGQISNPRLAAIQGLNKMKFLDSLGIKQAILPPQERPHLPTLKKIGFDGTIVDILSSARKNAPWLIPQVSSSASMWAANAATVSPSIDSVDSHIHFTPANLATYFHRSMEAETTRRVLRAIFPNTVYFSHHQPLPSSELFFDEGAANHTRFCKTYGGPGLQFFTFGKSMQDLLGETPRPRKYPARQTKEASEAIARLHRLFPGHAYFAFNNPSTIDAGAFHNDLVAVGNQNVLLIHEKALWSQMGAIEGLKAAFSKVSDTELIVIEVPEERFPLKDALASYFFNSQLVTLPDDSMALIAPESCREFENLNTYLNDLLTDATNPIGAIHYVDLSESLKNGGGPACLRLRVVMNSVELSEMNQGVLFTENLYKELLDHVTKYYPEQLELSDLGDPSLYTKSCESLDAISKILKLGDIYSFQNH